MASLNTNSVYKQEAATLKYDHLLLAIMDNNPYFSDGSKQVIGPLHHQQCSETNSPSCFSLTEDV